MASIVSAGTTSATALNMSADTTGILQLASNNGTVAVTVDTSQNMGIGTASPTNKLHVSSSSFETIKLQGTSTVSGINFVNSASSNGYIYYDNGPNMLFYTNGSERMRIDASGNLQFNSGYGSVAAAYGCRAWVNFNGTGTVAILASGNVSSITDNGTGDYTVNFTTAMPNANYAPTTMALSNDTGGTQGQCSIRGVSATGATTMTTTALRINTGVTSSNLFVDRALVTIAIFR